MEQFKEIAGIFGDIATIIGLILLLVKPIRNKFFGFTNIIEGMKCILRQSMLSIYYKHIEVKCLKQYEMEHFIYLYKAYKALGGNSFMEHIYSEVTEWTVIGR